MSSLLHRLTQADTSERRFSEFPFNSERSLERYTIHIQQMTSTRSKGGKQDGRLLMSQGEKSKTPADKMSCKNKDLYPNIFKNIIFLN